MIIIKSRHGCLKPKTLVTDKQPVGVWTAVVSCAVRAIVFNCVQLSAIALCSCVHCTVQVCAIVCNSSAILCIALCKFVQVCAPIPSPVWSEINQPWLLQPPQMHAGILSIPSWTRNSVSIDNVSCSQVLHAVIISLAHYLDCIFIQSVCYLSTLLFPK